MEIRQAIRDKTMTPQQVNQAMRELGAETDRNMADVLGEKKLDEWRAFQASQYPVPERPEESPPGETPQPATR
jgi:hypothetical protein